MSQQQHHPLSTLDTTLVDGARWMPFEYVSVRRELAALDDQSKRGGEVSTNTDPRVPWGRMIRIEHHLQRMIPERPSCNAVCVIRSSDLSQRIDEAKHTMHKMRERALADMAEGEERTTLAIALDRWQL
jgi:hypothetical protein